MHDIKLDHTSTPIQFHLRHNFISMKLRWLQGPLNELVFPFHLGVKYSTSTRTIMTGAKQDGPKQVARHKRPEKRPPLTHFLCLPLVNSSSISQLESTFATFKTEYPPVPVANLSNASNRQRARATIPEGAVRPLGTLHLTLGVMSLPTKDRLVEVLQFFHSLDLVGLMREAERVATGLRGKRKSHVRSNNTDGGPEAIGPQGHVTRASQDPDPIHVSLQSLHCLPRAKAATVLHAYPEDPTGRLHPFCVMLRDKFIEAGFILGEDKDKQKDYQKDKHTNDRKDAEGEQPPSESEIAPVPLDPWTAALHRKPKPRPLLLHATIVNTIYVRGRSNPKPDGPNPKKDKNKSRRLEFDARDILARYRDYYVDEARTIPRTDPATYVESTSAAENEDNRGEIVSTTSSPQYPFVWAKDIPIDTVCICEMGARKLSLDAEDAELNERLGEKYTVIAQRNLQASPSSISVTAGSAGVMEL